MTTKMTKMHLVVYALTIAAATLSLFAACHAKCSRCPFQWSEHQNHCYRYFNEPLSYDDSLSYCRRYTTEGRPDDVAGIDSLGEAIFTMDYVAGVFNGTAPFPAPGYVWLRGKNEGDDDRNSNANYSVLYYNALRAGSDSHSFYSSCDTKRPSVNVSLREHQDANSYGMVPAPDVVEHKCAVYAGEGAYIDLGDFAGTCVSDPDVCVSGSVTWSLWLRVNLSSDPNKHTYLMSTGGHTKIARGVYIAHKFQLEDFGDYFEIGARNVNGSNSPVVLHSKVALDRWFHVVLAVDLSSGVPLSLVYINGSLLVVNNTKLTTLGGVTDKCTSLSLGSTNICDGNPRDNSLNGISAAYSNVMSIDGLLTPEVIGKLHACGSLDWGLKVRSLYRDDTYTYSGKLRYVCKASASTGPTIYWRVYHADQAQWEDLTVDSTPTSFSTCVVQSVLVIDQSRAPSSEGDIISCTARADSLSASVYIRLAGGLNIGYSDHDNIGVFATNSFVQYYESITPKTLNTNGRTSAMYPFICKIPQRN